MAGTRRYQMTARAERAEETRLRIIAAAVSLFMENDDWSQVTLEGVAAAAGVTLQTVLRRFGSKAGLFNAAVEQTATEVDRLRTPGRPGDVQSALNALIDSYERLGELNWRLLCHETLDPALAALLVRARATHRTWLEQVFGHALPARGQDLERRLSLLFAATDFYLWKLERKDFGRSRAEAQQRITDLVEALLRDFARGEGT